MLKLKTLNLCAPILFGFFLLMALTSCKKEEAVTKPDEVDYYTCTMHPSVKKNSPTDKCPICSMDLVPVLKKSVANTNITATPGAVTKDKDENPGEFTVPAKRQQQIGVTYATIQKQPLASTIRVAGIVGDNKQPGSVWAEFYQDDLALVKVGLPATITTSACPGEKFSGRISSVDSSLNEFSRSARARIDLENRPSKLFPNQYVDVELVVQPGEGIAVPFDAVLPTGTHNIVFLDKGGGKLQPRYIELGRKYGNFYEVKAGLRESERVVTSANFLIDAEARVQGALNSW